MMIWVECYRVVFATAELSAIINNRMSNKTIFESAKDILIESSKKSAADILAKYNKGIADDRARIIKDILALRRDWSGDKLDSFGTEYGNNKLISVKNAVKEMNEFDSKFKK